MPFAISHCTRQESKDLTFLIRFASIGLRWCTEKDILSGKGKTTCGNKHCSADSSTGEVALHSYEVNMTYQEEDRPVQALLKVNLCPECAMRLNYKKIKDKLKKKEKKK